MVMAEPVIAVEERHGVRVDGGDLMPRVAEKGEFDVEREFFEDVQGAAVIDESIHRIDDETARGVLDGDDAER